MDKTDSKFLISKIEDKIRFCETKNKIQSTNFFDLSEQKIVEKYLRSNKITNYFYTGGFEKAERKMIIFYPEKMKTIVDKININKYLNVIRILLPNETKGKYNHRNYLGALMKLGIEREKIGDILVDNDGADIIILPEVNKFLLNNLPSLIRFSKSKIENIEIENLREYENKTEKIKITVSSMRLDNIVAEITRCSRAKAFEIIEEERVLINYEVFIKPSKEVKENDIITIRGKGRFIINNILR